MTNQAIYPPPNDNFAHLSNSRNYGIDLLRMLSMYMVCMLHILGQGGILASTISDPIRHSIAWFFEIAAYCAVNCFALISGYVGITSKFKYRNLFRLWLQAFFYTVGISVIFYFVKPGTIGVMGLIQAFFPLCTNAYWYLTAYALMFFAIPQMNFILAKQEKKDVKLFLWSFFVLFSLCSLAPIISGITGAILAGYSAIWLAYLYFAGGFIRIYGISELFSFPPAWKYSNGVTRFARAIFGSQCRRLAVYAICILAAFLIRVGGHHALNLIFGRAPLCWRVVSYNSPLILLSAIALLELFAHIQLSRGVAFIRFASPFAFGVYLIHCQRQIWNCMFEGAFRNCVNLPVWILPLAIIAIPLVIYILCSAIDFLRERLFKLLHLM